MRSEGWTGGKMELIRRSLEEHNRREGRRRSVKDDVERILGLNPKWWGEEDFDSASSESESEDSEQDCSAKLFVSHAALQSELMLTVG